MLSTQHWRLAVSALAATILCSAQASAGPLAMNDPNFPFGSIFQQIANDEADRIRRALKDAGGSKARAAQLLGIPGTTLNDRIRKLAIQ